MGPRRRQNGVERRLAGLRERRQIALQIHQAIDGQDRRAAPVRQDREALAGGDGQSRQDLRSIEQFLQREHAQQAGTPECGIVGAIRASQRAGVGKGSLGARLVAACFDDDHRLGSRGAARCGKELRRMRHRLHVKQDRPALRVARHEVEQIAEVDVRHITERDDMGKADLAVGRPVDHTRDEGAGLRQKGQIARQRRAMGEAAVEPDPRHHQPQRIRPLDAQQMRFRCIEHGLPQVIPDARGNHDRSTRALAAKLADEPRHRAQRRRDDRQIGSCRQGIDRRIAGRALDLLAVRIDEPDRATEPTGPQVACDDETDASGLGAGPDHCHRGGAQEMLEIANGHCRALSRKNPATAGRFNLTAPPAPVPRSLPHPAPHRRSSKPPTMDQAHKPIAI